MLNLETLSKIEYVNDLSQFRYDEFFIFLTEFLSGVVFVLLPVDGIKLLWYW